MDWDYRLKFSIHGRQSKTLNCEWKQRYIRWSTNMRIHHVREIIASAWRISGIITLLVLCSNWGKPLQADKPPIIAKYLPASSVMPDLCIASSTRRRAALLHDGCISKLHFSVFLSIDKEAGENTEQKLWVWIEEDAKWNVNEIYWVLVRLFIGLLYHTS